MTRVERARAARGQAARGAMSSWSTRTRLACSTTFRCADDRGRFDDVRLWISNRTIRFVPDFAEAGDPLLRHHHAAAGPCRLPRDDRAAGRAVRGQAGGRRDRHREPRLHPGRLGGHPPRRRLHPDPQAREAALRRRSTEAHATWRTGKDVAGDSLGRRDARPADPDRGRPCSPAGVRHRGGRGVDWCVAASKGRSWASRSDPSWASWRAH